MAHDEKLNERIRTALKDTPGIVEKNMFGGMMFMHNGNMLCGADLTHGLMVRVGPEQHAAVQKLKHALPMDITGRPMKGFVFVAPEGYKTAAALQKWIERGLALTNTLPRK